MGLEPIENSAVKLPKIGWVKFRQSREIPSGATLKQVRVVRRVSGWYAMLALQWDVSIPNIIPQVNPVGIDVSLTNFIASSDGLLTKRPKFFIDAERKLKLLQQSVSRKRRGSNNWKLRLTTKKFYWKDVFWSGSYFVSSCAGVTVSTLRKYIEAQQSPSEATV
jgi:putative transposase